MHSKDDFLVVIPSKEYNELLELKKNITDGKFVMIEEKHHDGTSTEYRYYTESEILKIFEMIIVNLQKILLDCTNENKRLLRFRSILAFVSRMSIVEFLWWKKNFKIE